MTTNRTPRAAVLVLTAALASTVLGLSAQAIIPSAGALPPPARPAPGSASAERAWELYRAGAARYAEGRLGEALPLLQAAIAERRTAFLEAGERISAILAEPKAARAKGSIAALIRVYAEADLIEREVRAIEREAGSSLRRKAELLLGRRLGDSFAGFLRAMLLVLERRDPALVGDSLEALATAAAELASYPEAELLVGRVYLAEGELRLAELQFRRALDQGESFEVPGDAVAAREALVRVYKDLGRFREYEEELRGILGLAPFFAKEDAFLRAAMERSLAGDGVDKFMVLYRLDLGPSTAAAAEIGEFYLRSGRPQALIHLAAALNSALSACIGRIQAREPSWTYSRLEELLSRMAADRELLSYASSIGLYRCAYFLGEALVSAGARDSARGIFRVLSARPESAPWDAYSRAALARPAGARAVLPP